MPFYHDDYRPELQPTPREDMRDMDDLSLGGGRCSDDPEYLVDKREDENLEEGDSDEL